MEPEFSAPGSEFRGIAGFGHRQKPPNGTWAIGQLAFSGRREPPVTKANLGKASPRVEGSIVQSCPKVETRTRVRPPEMETAASSWPAAGSHAVRSCPPNEGVQSQRRGGGRRRMGTVIRFKCAHCAPSLWQDIVSDMPGTDPRSAFITPKNPEAICFEPCR